MLTREKNEEKKKSDTISSIFTGLPGLVADYKLRIVAERNLLQANELANKFNVEVIFSGDTVTDLRSRAKNIVRHLEKAAQQFKQILKVNSDRNYAMEGEDQFMTSYLNCLLSYYITVSYATDKKFTQAFLLGSRALLAYEECMQLVETKLGGKEHVESNRPALAEKLTHMTTLMESLEKVKVRCHAKMLINKAEQNRAVQESL